MEEDIFINYIKIKKIRNIVGLEIPLNKSERKHLILTGKNGSGKTTLLLELKKFLELVFKGQYQVWEEQKNNLNRLESQLLTLKNNSTPEADIAFNTDGKAS